MRKILLALLVFCTPFIHFGSSEFLSVSFFCFSFFALFLVLAKSGLVLRAFLRIGAPLTAIVLIRSAINPDILPLFINLREIAVLVLILTLGLLAQQSKRPSFSYLYLVSGFVLIWGLLQLLDIYFLTGGGLFFPSEGWFNLSYGTLASGLYSKFGSVARPSAGFSEPSSLGAFGLCIFFIGVTAKRQWLTFIGVMLVLCSSSLSSMAGLTALVIVFSPRLPKRYFLFFVFCLGVGLIYAGQRIVIILAGADESTLQRLSFPLQLIAQHWSFWGIDKGLAVSFASSLGATANVFDNFFLGKAITDGLRFCVNCGHAACV